MENMYFLPADRYLAPIGVTNLHDGRAPPCTLFLHFSGNFSSITDISMTVAPIGVKFCVMVHIGTEHKVYPFGTVSPGKPQNPTFWPSKIKDVQNGESQR